MSDPQHISDEGSEATDFERELLHAAQRVRMDPGEKQAVWAAIALAAAPTALTATATATAGSKATLGLSSALKGVLVALGVGSASLGGYWLSRSPEPLPASGPVAAVPMTPPSVLAVQPTAVPGSDAPATPPSATSAREASAAVTREPTEQKSALRDESAAVLEIRRTLRSGDAAAALRLLEQARQRFPHGALSQEREALAIEALGKSGSRAAASQRAQAFLRAHPKSPYASDVQSFVTP